MPLEYNYLFAWGVRSLVSNKRTAFADMDEFGGAAFSLAPPQVLALALVALVLVPYGGWVMAYSILLGGVIYLLPALYFTHLVYRRHDRPPTAQALVTRFYFGEGQKMLLAAALFSLCFMLVKPLHAVAFAAAYVAAWAMNMAALAWLHRRNDEAHHRE